MANQQPSRINELEAQVTELFVTRLSDGKAVPVKDLRALITDELAEARSQEANPIAYSDTGPLEFGRHALAEAVVKKLEAAGRYEVVRGQRGDRVKLVAQPAAESRSKPEAGAVCAGAAQGGQGQAQEARSRPEPSADDRAGPSPVTQRSPISVLCSLWERLKRWELTYYLRMGAELNGYFKDHAADQPAGKTALAKAAAILETDESGLSLMREAARRYQSVEEVKGEFPSVSSWSELKAKLSPPQ